MNPIPLDLISFARIPKRDRIGDMPQYRIYIREVPGLLGGGYTDVVVVKGYTGWKLVDRERRLPAANGLGYRLTRDTAASELHLCEALIPEHVKAYLAEVDDG